MVLSLNPQLGNDGMYLEHFGLIEPPFSIVPNSRYLFLSERHREALQHLKMGLSSGGGFAMLTGEVGTGKTTVSKAMMATFDSNMKIGLILNPTFSSIELLEAICDQFKLNYPKQATLKALATIIQDFLYESHLSGYQVLLFIDEAQHLSAEVLEQLRLLTNIETDETKLLKVLLIGQPELQQNLQRTELRQLAQRITGRYHLLPLVKSEVADYIQFRLKLASGSAQLFSSSAVKCIAESTLGVPRLINLVCDKCLQLAYLAGEKNVSINIAKKALADIMAFQAPSMHSPVVAAKSSNKFFIYGGISIAVIALLGVLMQPQVAQWLTIDTQSKQIVVNNAEPTELNNIELNAIEMPPIETDLNPESLITIQDETPLWVTDTVMQSKHYYDAMRTLFAVWGYDASIIQSQCLSDTPSPFFCDTLQGNIAEVIAYNRPVVLTLESDNQTFYGVLYRVFDDQMEMLFGDAKLRLPIDWLEENWNGQYRTLWFSEVKETLKLGDSGDDVRKLDLLLSQVLSDSASNSDQFDLQLQARVKAFQSWQGLYVDGIAGKKTLQSLGKLANSSAPKLVSSATKHGSGTEVEAFQILAFPSFENLSPLRSAVSEQAIVSSRDEPVSEEVESVILEELLFNDEQPLAEVVTTTEALPEFDFDQLDLSELAPELASRVQSALDLPQGSREQESLDIEIYEIEALPKSISALLPDMNFQSHMYASQADKRWIKVNDKELQEGEVITDKVMVETIEPRRVILNVAGNRVAIPSLYEWYSHP
jgi:general secretion pathway protein A